MRALVLVLMAALAAGCASTRQPAPATSDPAPESASVEPAEPSAPEEAEDPEAEDASSDSDPWQGYNRAMWSFDDAVDQYALRPLALGWSFLLPEVVQVHFQQFLDNLLFPRTFVNDLFQGEVKRSGVELGRFLVNSTVGLAGFFDPATSIGLDGRPEDFDQTLGVWGAGAGPYVVLPFLGPSSGRGLGALPLDLALLPPGHFFLTLLNQRGLNDDEIQQLRSDSLDWYTFVRNSYRQRREAAVRNGEIEPEETDDDFYDLDE